MADTRFDIDRGWTLFLDRDGVINKRLHLDYVKTISEFELLPGVQEALKIAADLFATIVVVTNQQGIGKGIMTEAKLHQIHNHMLQAIEKAGGRIDKVYHCPKLASENADCRKPNAGMAMQAKADFPTIDFAKSVMIGDSPSDIEFGRRLGMKCIHISTEPIIESAAPSLLEAVNRYLKP